MPFGGGNTFGTAPGELSKDLILTAALDTHDLAHSNLT